MAFFDQVELASIDPILGVQIVFAQDKRENKINLGVGTYKTADLKPHILSTVKKVEKKLLDDETSKEYLPIEGDKTFLERTQELVLGQSDERVFVAQTVGGTGALRIGGEFLKSLGFTEIFIPNPTWDNHRRVFSHSSLKVDFYPYYDRTKRRFDFEAMLTFLKQMPKKSAILLQGCCHNPTGFDPTLEQWKQILDVLKEREILPFFDFSYQGFGDGLSEDRKALVLFANSGIEMLIASSYSKNFGLYAERAGAFFALTQNKEGAKKVGSQIKVIIRGLYSNPPLHGAKVVSMILSDSDLRKQWEHEVEAMRLRIEEMRKALASSLQAKNGKIDYSFMLNQKGMFSYTGLETSQVQDLIATYGIYMPSDGRINIAGLNSKNLNFVADAIIEVTKIETC